MSLNTLNEKINELEQKMLAISSVSDICQQSIMQGNSSANLQSCAEFLEHLIEPAMYQVEALRVLISEMCERPKVRKLKGV